MIYSLDEVERPRDKIINDDEKIDEWYEAYREDNRRQLEESHKNDKGRHIDKGVPNPRRGFVYGGKKK